MQLKSGVEEHLQHLHPQLNAAAQRKRLRAAIEMTMVRGEADALTAASTHEECVLVRRTLTVVSVMMRRFFCTVQSEGSPHIFVGRISQV